MTAATTTPTDEATKIEPVGVEALKAETAELPKLENTEPAQATATAERPPRRTGGIVTATRTPGSAGTRPPSTTRPPATARPPAGPPEAVRPPTAIRTPVAPDPATTEGAPPSTDTSSAGASIVLPPVREADADTAFDAPPGRLTPAARKTLRRRRLVALVVFIVLAVIVLVVGQFIRRDDGRKVAVSPVASALAPGAEPGAGIGEATAAETPTQTAATTAPPSAATSAARAPADTADATPTKVAVGALTAFTFASGYGPVLGTNGTVRRFKVAVERTLGQGNGGDFADEIDRTLGDPRSWIAGRQFRLQRVPASAASEFTVYLASAKSSERMCDAGGLKTNGYTSCRLPGQVIINQDRWQDAVPDYHAPLATYRAYAINHEVGHQLGYGHEACTGTGKPAPVMQQQTYGLNGCVANSWPYLNGKRYVGRPTD